MPAGPAPREKLAVRRFIVGLAMLLGSALVQGEPPARLYATSIRMHFGEGTPRMECNLYQVDPANGQSRILAQIHSGGLAVAIVSLAIHPQTNQIFGVSDATSPALPRSLVMVDAASGATSRVGPLAERVSDIGFSNDGTLYGWLPEASRLARIDARTGAIAPLEPSGITGVMGGGMALDDDDQGFVAATSATGTLDRIDIRTGRATPGAALQGAPHIAAITNLTFSPENRLYGVNSNLGAPAATTLVRIDPKTGRIEPVGRLPDDSHALIFVPQPAAKAAGVDAWITGLVGLAVVLVLAAAAFLIGRRRRRAP